MDRIDKRLTQETEICTFKKKKSKPNEPTQPTMSTMIMVAFFSLD